VVLVAAGFAAFDAAGAFAVAALAVVVFAVAVLAVAVFAVAALAVVVFAVAVAAWAPVARVAVAAASLRGARGRRGAGALVETLSDAGTDARRVRVPPEEARADPARSRGSGPSFRRRSWSSEDMHLTSVGGQDTAPGEVRRASPHRRRAGAM
jgi:hypothetical protein